jgi:hypothetical protein
MYQKDLIMRMLEILTELIAAIFGLIKKGEFPEASRILDNAYYDYLKQDAAFFKNIPIEDLTDRLLKEHHFNNAHLETLSGLFYAQAELFKAQGLKIESVTYYEKSLVLLEFVLQESNVLSLEKQARADTIRKQMDEVRDVI